jgi:non-heme chloroperoxidase
MRKMPRLLVILAAISLFAGWIAGADKKAWKDASIQVADIKIHYVEMGAGDRTMVLIPTWSLYAEVWKEQLPYFASRGFRVIALDMRSHGQTTRTEAGNTYQQHAADLHAFLKTMKIEHANLVGWGSGVTTLLEYISSPESLQPDNLVFVDGNPCGFKDSDYPYGMTPQAARTFGLSLQEDRKKATEQWVIGLFKSKQGLAILTELAAGSQKVSTGAALSLFFDSYTGDRRPALARIPVPTLLLMSQDNRLLGEYLQSKIKRSKLEVIPDSGHAIMLEKPQAFNQILESFLGAN